MTTMIREIDPYGHAVDPKVAIVARRRAVRCALARSRRERAQHARQSTSPKSETRVRVSYQVQSIYPTE